MGHRVCTEVEDEERREECVRKGGGMQSAVTCSHCKQPITHKPMLATGKHRSDKRQRKVHDGHFSDTTSTKCGGFSLLFWYISGHQILGFQGTKGKIVYMPTFQMHAFSC